MRRDDRQTLYFFRNMQLWANPQANLVWLSSDGAVSTGAAARVRVLLLSFQARLRAA
jgi:hypothetical protein